MQWLLYNLGLRGKCVVRFVGRAANGAAGPVFGVAARVGEGFGARSVEDVGEGFEGQCAGYDDGEGGLGLCDDGVGDVVKGWVGVRGESVLEEDEAEARCGDEACGFLAGGPGGAKMF
jgi:hypothetical protein